ncbi:MAG: Na+/phosphate symporter [Paraglaciecola sp.]|jgi:Na+/phosphate symporter
MKIEKLPGIFAIVVILSMMAFVGIQSDKIEELQYFLEETSTDLEATSSQLVVTETQLEEAKVTIAELEEEIARLNGIISNMDKEIAEYKESLKNLRGRIAKLKDKVDSLSKEITELQQEKNANWLRINDLIKEKEQAESEISSLRIKEETIEEVKQEVELEAAIKVDKNNELNELRRMLTSTIVNFQKVNVLKKEDGSPMKKVKRKNKNWNYTHIQFSLDNANPKILSKYQYVVKVLDLDTGLTMPHNENNQQFPDGPNNTDGYILDYDGNLADILYFNNTKRESQNYEVRVYVRLNGNDLPLTKGRCPLVEHGKTVTIQ